MKIHLTQKEVMYPFCGYVSSRVHSIYQRKIQDISLLDIQRVLLLDTRKMFCTNSKCGHKTFTERFDFLAPNAQKTKWLIDKILITLNKLSSVSAITLLKSSNTKTCKSSICDLLKKMPAIVDKTRITPICVDDFALRIRYAYGTVMVNLESHRITRNKEC